VASQKGQASGGAGDGHRSDGGKEFLLKGGGFHAIPTADTASEELGRRTKEIKQFASKRSPVPSCIVRLQGCPP